MIAILGEISLELQTLCGKKSRTLTVLELFVAESVTDMMH